MIARVAALVLALAAGPAAADPALVERALELANGARAEAGLAPLALDPGLVAAADAHAGDMLARGYLDHVAPDGDGPAERLGLGARWSRVAENIADCTGCVADAGQVAAFQDGWMASPGHRANLLDPDFEAFGFAIAEAGGRVTAVQTFAGGAR